MKVTIDRFEGEFAVVETENDEMVNMPKVLVPNAKEGDIICICIDNEAGHERRERIRELQSELFSD